jgi:hypothetical protein
MITRLKKEISLAASLDDFNESIAHIQSIIGVTSGDNAGMYFSGFEMEDNWVSSTKAYKKDILLKYLLFEILTNCHEN